MAIRLATYTHPRFGTAHDGQAHLVVRLISYSTQERRAVLRGQVWPTRALKVAGKQHFEERELVIEGDDFEALDTFITNRLEQAIIARFFATSTQVPE